MPSTCPCLVLATMQLTSVMQPAAFQNLQVLKKTKQNLVYLQVASNLIEPKLAKTEDDLSNMM